MTQVVRPGEPNQLEVRVIQPGRADDRFPYHDVLVGFLPYVFDNFGGIWQDVTLVAQRAPAFADVQVAPQIDGAVVVRATARGQVSAEILDPDGQTVASAVTDDASEIRLKVAQPRPWSPRAPNLYTLRLTLDGGAQTTRRFGFRDLRAEGDQVRLNGEPFHLRGVLSWGWDPQTLAPSPSDAAVRDEFRRVRELGFNMVKLCLFVPTENVFRIADEEGMLLWLELPLWLPHLTDHLRDQARVEYADIMAQVNHHPSVVVYSLGCELGSDMADAALLDALNGTVRGASCGALVCDNSGSGEAYHGLNFDYADFNDYHFYADMHDFVPLLDLFRRDWRPPRPLIFGEFCDCDDYRDPAALLEDGQRPRWRDYLGVEGNLRRWAYLEQEARMAANDPPVSDAELAVLARKQSLLVRKTILERTRLRRDIGGYVVTGLRDTPGGTSGIFDDSGRSKYPAAAFRGFNDDAVLLLESGRARRWVHGGDRPDPIDLFNYSGGAHVSLRAVFANSGATLHNARFKWQLTAPDGSSIASGDEALDDPLPPGTPRQIAAVEFTLPQVAQAMICRLTFTLSADEQVA